MTTATDQALVVKVPTRATDGDPLTPGTAAYRSVVNAVAAAHPEHVVDRVVRVEETLDDRYRLAVAHLVLGEWEVEVEARYTVRVEAATEAEAREEAVAEVAGGSEIPDWTEPGFARRVPRRDP